MTETLPDHETIEYTVKKMPDLLLDKLPDNTERRRAKQHIDLAYEYAREARERPADRAD